VFPYSEFRDETVQGIDTQIECITGDGFGDLEAQIVQRDIPVAINCSGGAIPKSFGIMTKQASFPASIEPNK